MLTAYTSAPSAVLLFQLPSSVGEFGTARFSVPPCCRSAGSTRFQPVAGRDSGSADGPEFGSPGAQAVSASNPAPRTATAANAVVLRIMCILLSLLGVPPAP